MKHFFSVALLILSTQAKSQHCEPTEIINLLIKETQGFIISIRPLKSLHIDTGVYFMRFSQLNMRQPIQLDTGNLESYELDTIMFKNILANAQHLDTTNWQFKEVGERILVTNRNDFISSREVLKALKNRSIKERLKIKGLVKAYNKSSNYRRVIYYYSRPVFDSSGKFAVMEWDNGHSGLAGGGALVLFECVEGIWIKRGNVTYWNY